ncbi:hypothetical protein JGU66_27690 [Myxococcaceae bacterium JPH2]|nr:hypothetical protein [Myxococcaceae bacterium JPH2]
MENLYSVSSIPEETQEHFRGDATSIHFGSLLLAAQHVDALACARTPAKVR